MRFVSTSPKEARLVVGFALLISLFGCGGTSNGASTTSSASTTTTPTTTPTPTPTPTPSPTPTPTPTPTPPPTPTPIPTPTPVHGPVVVVLEENHGYASVIGNAAMPYLNGLANQYALATQYYADTHPSIDNYFMLTTGQMLANNDDGYTATVNADNLVRHLLSAGKTWKSYAENLPSVGYTGPDLNGYVEHHNPFSYFSDVRGSAAQSQNLVPFTQFQPDLNNGQLPDFSFVVPNLNDDAHDGTLAQADLWLQQNIGPVLTNAQFQNGGLLIVVFDEAADSDTTHGGGQVPMVMAGPNVKAGFQGSSLYQHENLLKAITTYMGIDGNLGNAASAGAMTEFLK